MVVSCCYSCDNSRQQERIGSREGAKDDKARRHRAGRKAPYFSQSGEKVEADLFQGLRRT